MHLSYPGPASSAFSPWVSSGCTVGCKFSSVQLLRRVQLFVTPWTVASQASLSITNFQATGLYLNQFVHTLSKIFEGLVIQTYQWSNSTSNCHFQTWIKYAKKWCGFSAPHSVTDLYFKWLGRVVFCFFFKLHIHRNTFSVYRYIL